MLDWGRLNLFGICDLDEFMDAACGGMLVIDADGKIVWGSQTYLNQIGQDASVFGNYLLKARGPGAHLSRVINSGISEIGEVRNFRGNPVIVARKPLYHNGELKGAVATVLHWSFTEAQLVHEKIRQHVIGLSNDKAQQDSPRAKYQFHDIYTKDPKMLKLISTAQRASMTPSTVLLRGESGTGKEMFAHAIHNASTRRTAPFITINVPAIPEQLLESELFGYEDGAFTGARRNGKPGKIELADGGTVFLDEIGDISYSAQVKLLRFLQFKEFERVGSTRSKNVHVRIIAATNQDLERLVGEGKFREDLYYRINVVPITIPPLRERISDIPLLAHSIINKFNDEMDINVEGLTPEAEKYLQSYSWPGNIRELENVLERAINITTLGAINTEHLMFSRASDFRRNLPSTETNLDPVEKAEKEKISKALLEAKGNKTDAAKILGLTRVGLYKKMQRLKINDLELR